MLSVNKPLMKQKFASMLMDRTGLFYKAAYNAQYEMLKQEYDMWGSGFSKSKALKVMKGKTVKTIEIDNLSNKWKDQAETFAKAFTKALRDGNLDDILANEIDKHVKAIEMIITVQPQALATVVSPMGPCTGTLVISKATATTQFL